MHKNLDEENNTDNKTNHYNIMNIKDTIFKHNSSMQPMEALIVTKTKLWNIKDKLNEKKTFS